MRFLNKTNHRQTYHHNSNQPGWIDTSPRVGYANNQLDDDHFNNDLSSDHLLWRYIITHYPKELITPIVVLGDQSTAIAIELSQWDYPITYISDSFQSVERFKKNCEIHAGSIHQSLYFDFTKNCPPARLIIFVGIIDQMKEDEQIYTFLDRVVAQGGEVLCSVLNNRDWKSILESRYNVEGTLYPDQDKVLLKLYESNVTKS